MRNQRPSGLLCGCGATRILCECIRDQDSRPCCWACEHHDLPADIRQPASPATTLGKAPMYTTRNTSTTAARLSIWPVLRLDFNQARTDGVWTVIDQNEVDMWDLRVGSEVVAADYDDAQDLRFRGTIAALRPCGPHAPGRWYVEINR